MKNAYYYLVSSLPYLQFGQPSSVSYEGFMAQCRRELSAADFSQVQKAALDYDGSRMDRNPALCSWAKFNRNFKNHVARYRAIQQGKNPAEQTKEGFQNDRTVADLVAEAAGMKYPLATQKVLDRFRWKFLDSLGKEQNFDLNFLIAYALKLLILERYKRVEFPTKGKQIFARYQKLGLKHIEGKF